MGGQDALSLFLSPLFLMEGGFVVGQETKSREDSSLYPRLRPVESEHFGNLAQRKRAVRKCCRMKVRDFPGR